MSTHELPHFSSAIKLETTRSTLSFFGKKHFFKFKLSWHIFLHSGKNEFFELVTKKLNLRLTIFRSLTLSHSFQSFFPFLLLNTVKKIILSKKSPVAGIVKTGNINGAYICWCFVFNVFRQSQLSYCKLNCQQVVVNANAEVKIECAMIRWNPLLS